jgi:hypothetical protein
MVTKTVKDFAEFERKYGGARHALHGLNKPSIYSKSGHKSRKHRAKIKDVTYFSKLPQAKRYRSGVPIGWRGDSYRHGLSAQGIPNAPSQSRNYAPKRKAYATYVSPETIQISPKFSATEFDINKRKSLGEKMVESGMKVREAREGYGKLREEALEANVVAPPETRDIAPEFRRDLRTIGFYGTKTGQAVKFVGDKVKAFKVQREQKEKEKKYQQAQDRAEQARIEQLEIQTRLRQKKIAELKGDKTGIQDLAEEAKKTETPEEIAKDYARV